jgi:hypothetical protein
MDYRDIPLYPYEADPFGIMAMRRRAIAAVQERAAIEAEAAKSAAAAAAQEQEPEPDPEPEPEPEKPPEPPPPGPRDDEDRDRENSGHGEGEGAADGEDDAYGLQSWLVEHRDAVLALVAARLPPGAPPPSAPPEPEPPTPDLPTPDPSDLPPVHVRRGDRWTKPKMVDFLRQLAATHSISAAARSVGMSRNSAYRLRARLKGQPFDIAWEAAFRHGYDNLAHAALDRAINGVEVPHYRAGELVGTSRKYDERLTVALLAMRNRAGVPMLGRYGAAAEYWGERWDAMLERVGTGPVDWSEEQKALGEQQRRDLLDPEREVRLLEARNAPDERPRRGPGK